MMRERILESLRGKSEYVSGDFISQRLGITRQALWKHIQELKESGYEIAAVPHLGYRLAGIPDRLFSSEISWGLNTKFMARKIYYFESLASTMDAAMQLGLKGSPEGTLIVAESQAKGRGRLGRSWFSPKYKGIYLSFILRPKILPAQAPILTLLSAISICQAAEESSGIGCQIKWPNDILSGNKKLGGILTELHAEMDKVNFVVIGMGLNVNNDKKTLLPGAASLKEIKKESFNRVILLQEILRRIESNYFLLQEKGAPSILDIWRQYALTLGRRVKVDCHKQHIEGEAVDIDVDGSLLVRQDCGLIIKITAGDVLHCR
jgi:BirA family biotin operon repressor/biotin-[acetyl-CoA-carboxylase] ligase